MMVTVGALGVFGGPVLIGVGVRRANEAVTGDSLFWLPFPDFNGLGAALGQIIAGAIIAPAGIALVTVGAVMLARAHKLPATVQLSPSSVTWRF
jgi:hypothetical protein